MRGYADAPVTVRYASGAVSIGRGARPRVLQEINGNLEPVSEPGARAEVQLVHFDGILFLERPVRARPEIPPALLVLAELDLRRLQLDRDGYARKGHGGQSQYAQRSAWRFRLRRFLAPEVEW